MITPADHVVKLRSDWYWLAATPRKPIAEDTLDYMLCSLTRASLWNSGGLQEGTPIPLEEKGRGGPRWPVSDKLCEVYSPSPNSAC